MPIKKQDKDGLDAIQLLKQDHELVGRLFDEFERAGADRKFELAHEICRELAVHTAIEEEIFYPRVREVIEADDLMCEAGIEHDTVTQLIERIQDGEVDEIQLSAIIKVMNDYVNHHVNEEHRRMFPRVKRAKIDLHALGGELQARRLELEAGLDAAMADESGSDPDPARRVSDEDTPRPSRGGMAARAPSGDDR